MDPMTNAPPVFPNPAPDDALSDAYSSFEATGRKSSARHTAANANNNFLQVNRRLLPRYE